MKAFDGSMAFYSYLLIPQGREVIRYIIESALPGVLARTGGIKAHTDLDGRWIDAMLYVEPHKVIYHERKKRQGRQQHDLQSERSVTCVVRESGLSFTVDLTNRIDTGLFLDHVETRRLIRNTAFGCDVLHLF